MDGHPWPLFDIRIWTERLELRLPTEPELIELLELAQSGIHDPNEMPFGFAWTDQLSPFFERSFMQYHWSTRASWSAGKWALDLGVWLEGRLVSFAPCNLLSLGAVDDWRVNSDNVSRD